LRASVLLHPPVDPTRFASRKALSHAVWQAVADGASLLRQNRAVEIRTTEVAERAYA
jgi:1-acyl-sn-glycerol-3-phosphate acyltransferase